MVNLISTLPIQNNITFFYNFLYGCFLQIYCLVLRGQLNDARALLAQHPDKQMATHDVSIPITIRQSFVLIVLIRHLREDILTPSRLTKLPVHCWNKSLYPSSALRIFLYYKSTTLLLSFSPCFYKVSHQAICTKQYNVYFKWLVNLMYLRYLKV